VVRDYPSDWDERQRTVYRRDNYTCANCGRKGRPYGGVELQAHHVVPRSRGGTSKRSNLATLCAACHDATHGRGMAPTAPRVERDRLDLVARLVTVAVLVAAVAVFEWLFEVLNGGPPTPTEWVVGLAILVPLYFGVVAAAYSRAKRETPLPAVIRR
jgi:hypothetical protein